MARCYPHQEKELLQIKNCKIYHNFLLAVSRKHVVCQSFTSLRDTYIRFMVIRQQLHLSTGRKGRSIKVHLYVHCIDVL